MKAGCSIVEKPEGGGGEQQPSLSTRAECPSAAPFSPLGLWSQMPDQDRQPLDWVDIAGTAEGLCPLGVAPTCLVPTPCPQLSCLCPVRDKFQPWGKGVFSCAFLPRGLPFLFLPFGTFLPW